LEATGVYSLRLALALHRAERVVVMVVNPRAIKDFQRARLCRAKTDAVDALGILEFLQRMEFVPWTPPTDAVLALPQIGRRLVQLRGELTREQARLHAIAFTPDRDGLIAADLHANIRHLQKRLKSLHLSAAELAAHEPDLAVQVPRLCSVPGIGELSALRLLGELLVLPKDLKAKPWVAHAGLDPRPRPSGATAAPRPISRTGNRHLRLALFMPALVATPAQPASQGHLRSLPGPRQKEEGRPHRPQAPDAPRHLGHAPPPPRLQSPTNDPKLSDGGAWRGTCMEGGKAARGSSYRDARSSSLQREAV